MIISSISEESSLEGNEREYVGKIINMDKNNQNLIIFKMSKIKDEIKNSVIDRYYNIICKLNKENQAIKKKYDDLLKKTQDLLKIIKTQNNFEDEKIDKNKRIAVTENNYCFVGKKGKFQKYNSLRNKLIKVSLNSINESKNISMNKTNKSIEINKQQIYYLNKRKNKNKSVFCCSNGSLKRTIDLGNKENINKNYNNNYDYQNKNQININYLKELNKKDLQKMIFIKQKIINTALNKNILNNIQVNLSQKKK